ncbi:MAG: 16S rRNA (cytosine(1402)-N(4))-methyltransferase RsmH [Balneolales bacterium]|nr:16S rRNA (cytosine(1402)-N(4))-methyltransferase RsmH [Balneolales bacterium]
MQQSETSYHIPVMKDECLHWLSGRPNGIYVDGTLGAGGHTKALLATLGPDARVFGIDHDDDALAEAAKNINDSRFEAVKGNFGFMQTLLPPDYTGKVDGILLDLGVSSYQIDEPSRGFTYREDGPLDMRMSRLRALTAADVVNEYSYERLRDLLFEYGEERRSIPIAKTIISQRPLESTFDLKKCVESVVKGPHTIKSISRVFQAIRIEVNQELEMLKQGLEQAVSMLRDEGRIVVMSYHSLEDRIVKQFFKAGNFTGKQDKDFYGNLVRPLQPLFAKPLSATAEEQSQNPRSRSARLRVAEKVKQEAG